MDRVGSLPKEGDLLAENDRVPSPIDVLATHIQNPWAIHGYQDLPNKGSAFSSAAGQTNAYRAILLKR